MSLVGLGSRKAIGGFGCCLMLIIISFLTFHVSSGSEVEVEDDICLGCHDDKETGVAEGVHQLVSLGGNQESGVGCVSCHSGGPEHIEDPEIANIGNPARMTGQAAREACRECHNPHLNLDNYGYDPHFEMQVNCASCHRVHGSEPDLLLSDKAEFCTGCHSVVLADFTANSQHPLLQQNITCLSCHRFSRRPDSRERSGLLRICEDCHPQQGGPFPYDHEAANSLSAEGGSCLECHHPHGSENDRLLKQPREFLCLQCHVTPAGHVALPALHGSIRDIDNCQACHSDIHGSFVSPLFLDGMLQSRLGSTQPCADCHDLTR